MARAKNAERLLAEPRVHRDCGQGQECSATAGVAKKAARLRVEPRMRSDRGQVVPRMRRDRGSMIRDGRFGGEHEVYERIVQPSKRQPSSTRLEVYSTIKGDGWSGVHQKVRGWGFSRQAQSERNMMFLIKARAGAETQRIKVGSEMDLEESSTKVGSETISPRF